MGVLLLFLGFLAFRYGSAYSVGPSFTWPEEYHFRAEDINLMSGVVKPFEIWYSTEHNKSRIDFYGGTVSRYYHGLATYYNESDYGDSVAYSTKIYMMHPEYSKRRKKSFQKCRVEEEFEDHMDFLPSLEGFNYEDSLVLNGKKVQRWKSRDESNFRKILEEEILIYEENNVGIPVRHTKKRFFLSDGSLRGHNVVNYYNYESKFDVKDLEVPKSQKCFEYYSDFHKAVENMHPEISSDVEMVFKSYKKHHSMKYTKDFEHEWRREIFKSNWELVKEHNSKNLGYTLELNEFADKTSEELSYLRGIRSSPPTNHKNGEPTTTRKPTPIRSSTKPPPIRTDKKPVDYNVEDLPENFDLRMLGLITPVRNQAHCGSCWAFAATATMEGAYARASGGRLLKFSEQSLVDCAWDYDSYGCGGTLSIESVFEYLDNFGIPTMQEYGPYLEEDGLCKVNNLTKVYHLDRFHGVPPGSERALKSALYNYGPVTVALYVSDKMAFYKNGIFYDPECPEGPINHAVTLIGYGHKDGQLYWIIKNSWGENWGSDGYLYISAKNDNCNVMRTPYHPIIESLD